MKKYILLAVINTCLINAYAEPTHISHTEEMIYGDENVIAAKSQLKPSSNNQLKTWCIAQVEENFRKIGNVDGSGITRYEAKSNNEEFLFTAERFMCLPGACNKFVDNWILHAGDFKQIVYEKITVVNYYGKEQTLHGKMTVNLGINNQIVKTCIGTGKIKVVNT